MSLNLSGVRTFQSRGRTTHVAWDGLEIQKEFYLDPFGSAPAVVEALQGSVFQDDDKQWKRRIPAIDPYYDNCFCNEARIDHIDSQKKSITISTDLEFAPGLAEAAVPNVDNYRRFMAQVNTVRDIPAGGCFITASYRPLLSAYLPEILPSFTEEQKQLARSPMFDWIDPQWVPGFETVPWPDGLAAVFRHGVTGIPVLHSVPPSSAKPIVVPVIEFTIRRLLIGAVPWNTINRLNMVVNDSTWPGDNWPQVRFRKLFPKGTLRFEGAEVLEHYSPATPGGFWFELIYHFRWLSLEDFSLVHDDTGLQRGRTVTWNHVLISPDAGLLGSLGLTTRDAGWYHASKLDLLNWAPWLGGDTIGPIYNLGLFDPLFDLQST